MSPTEIIERPRPTERRPKPRSVQRDLERTRMAREKVVRSPHKHSLSTDAKRVERDLDQEVKIEGYEGPLIKGPKPSTGHKRTERPPVTDVLLSESDASQAERNKGRRGRRVQREVKQDLRPAPERRSSELNRLVDTIKAAHIGIFSKMEGENAVKKRERTLTKFGIGDQIAALHSLEEALFDFFEYLQKNKGTQVEEEDRDTIRNAFDYYYKWVVDKGLGQFSEDREDPDKFYPVDLKQRVNRI